MLGSNENVKVECTLSSEGVGAHGLMDGGVNGSMKDDQLMMGGVVPGEDGDGTMMNGQMYAKTTMTRVVEPMNLRMINNVLREPKPNEAPTKRRRMKAKRTNAGASMGNIKKYFTNSNMAFPGSILSRGIFSDYPRDF